MVLIALQEGTAMVGIVTLTVVIFGALGFLVLKCVRWLNARSEASLGRIYQDFGIPTPPSKNDVTIVFPTYHGFLVYVIQTKHQLTLPADQAEQLLRRLHEFNRKWGLLAGGAFLIPLVSFANCRIQRSRIRRQLAEKRAAQGIGE